MAEQKDKSPDHVSVVPFNEEIEKEKRERFEKELELRKGQNPGEQIVTLLSGEKKIANELNLEEQQQEIIRCAQDPIHFICTYLTIFDQTKGDGGAMVPFSLFPFQKKLVMDYKNHRFNVANKYRQAGISTTTCGYISWYIMFGEHRNVAIIADKLETARDEMMHEVVEFIEKCPDWLRPEPTHRDTMKHKHYDNDCQLRAFSSKGLRGYTPTLLFWDETAWTERSDQFWTSARPTLQTGGRAIFVSCVTKDSFVFTDKGIKQVKDFIQTEELGGHYIDDTYFVGAHKIRKSNIIFNNGYVDTYKIKTSYSELESSENHKFWVYKNGKYKWVKASELEVDDYVSMQKGANIWGFNDDCSDFKPTESNHIKKKFKPTKITPDIAYLIGLYISEGCGIKRRNKYNGITITCGDDISYVLNKLNISFNKKDDLHYEIESLNMSEFFEYLGFDISKKAPQKIIPPRLLEMSKDNMVAMMQGIMDGDGWATYNSQKNKLRIGIGLSSLELIKQLRVILSNFGVLTEFQQVTTPPTKKVKVESVQYRLTANGSYAKKYFEEIGFRLNRKKIIVNDYDVSKLGHVGVSDNIPNGTEIINEIYDNIKYYGLYNHLNEHDIKIKYVVQKSRNISKPSSRKTILNLIDLMKNEISNDLLEKYDHIINENIVWTKITSIEKSKDWTYDFSMSNENPKEEDEFHMQLTYNQFITHNTPNGLDPVFYKHFEGAQRGKNNFNAIELWWYNDPRYTAYKKELTYDPSIGEYSVEYGYNPKKKEGELDLYWVKNKGKENENKIKDENWTQEKRKQMVEDGWEATSTWFEAQVRDYNGDMKKLAQELLCVFGDSIITIRNKITGLVEKISIEDFYLRLEEENNSCDYL